MTEIIIALITGAVTLIGVLASNNASVLAGVLSVLTSVAGLPEVNDRV